MSTILLSYLDDLSLGYNVDAYEEEIASNLDEYAHNDIFLSLKYENIERIVSKQTQPISFQTAKALLTTCVQKFGLQSITLLKYLRVEPIDHTNSVILLKIFSQCPIISHLNSIEVSDEELGNPFMSALISNSKEKNNDFEDDMELTDDIFTACQKGNVPRVIKCIDDDPEIINTRDLYMRTPLHVAASAKQFGVCKVLIEKGSDVNAHSNWDYTALHYAAMNDCPDIVELLLNNNAKADAKTDHGLTPLIIAASGKSLKACELLVEHGADVNASGNNGQTPLSEATDKDITMYLQSKGAY